MAIKFSTTANAKTNGVKILCYGAAGVGKTTLCATAPRPLIISAEAGLLSLRHHNIKVIEVTTLDDLNEAFTYCQTPAARKEFSTVCLDSITEIAEKVLAHAKGQVKDPRQAYGELQDQMIECIKAFRDLEGYHVYMCAKMEPRKDPEGITRYMPAMPGSKLGPMLPYLFDIVLHLGIGESDGATYRYLRTQPDVQFEAKDRSGALAEIEEPHLTKLIDKIIKSHVHNNR